MIFRNFLPVGQGAFYLERFILNDIDKPINVIYDCGSYDYYNKKSVKKVNHQIIRLFNENETIDAVFISHFHEDHINGLELLLKHCDVKNIFIPLIDNDIKEILLIQYLIEHDFNGFQQEVPHF